MELSSDQLEKLYESGELAVHRLKAEKLVLKSIIGKDCTLRLCLGPAYTCIVT